MYSLFEREEKIGLGSEDDTCRHYAMIIFVNLTLAILMVVLGDRWLVFAAFILYPPLLYYLTCWYIGAKKVVVLKPEGVIIRLFQKRWVYSWSDFKTVRYTKGKSMRGEYAYLEFWPTKRAVRFFKFPTNYCLFVRPFSSFFLTYRSDPKAWPTDSGMKLIDIEGEVFPLLRKWNVRLHDPFTPLPWEKQDSF